MEFQRIRKVKQKHLEGKRITLLKMIYKLQVNKITVVVALILFMGFRLQGSFPNISNIELRVNTIFGNMMPM